MTQTKQRRSRKTYTDEFKNQVTDDILETFNIERSLIMRGCPYDNAFDKSPY